MQMTVQRERKRLEWIWKANLEIMGGVPLYYWFLVIINIFSVHFIIYKQLSGSFYDWLQMNECKLSSLSLHTYIYIYIYIPWNPPLFFLSPLSTTPPQFLSLNNQKIGKQKNWSIFSFFLWITKGYNISKSTCFLFHIKLQAKLGFL